MRLEIQNRRCVLCKKFFIPNESEKKTNGCYLKTCSICLNKLKNKYQKDSILCECGIRFNINHNYKIRHFDSFHHQNFLYINYKL